MHPNALRWMALGALLSSAYGAPPKKETASWLGTGVHTVYETITWTRTVSGKPVKVTDTVSEVVKHPSGTTPVAETFTVPLTNSLGTTLAHTVVTVEVYPEKKTSSSSSSHKSSTSSGTRRRSSTTSTRKSSTSTKRTGTGSASGSGSKTNSGSSSRTTSAHGTGTGTTRRSGTGTGTRSGSSSHTGTGSGSSSRTGTGSTHRSSTGHHNATTSRTGTRSGTTSRSGTGSGSSSRTGTGSGSSSGSTKGSTITGSAAATALNNIPQPTIVTSTAKNGAIIIVLQGGAISSGITLDKPTLTITSDSPVLTTDVKSVSNGIVGLYAPLSKWINKPEPSLAAAIIADIKPVEKDIGNLIGNLPSGGSFGALKSHLGSIINGLSKIAGNLPSGGGVVSAIESALNGIKIDTGKLSSDEHSGDQNSNHNSQTNSNHNSHSNSNSQSHSSSKSKSSGSSSKSKTSSSHTTTTSHKTTTTGSSSSRSSSSSSGSSSCTSPSKVLDTTVLCTVTASASGGAARRAVSSCSTKTITTTGCDIKSTAVTSTTTASASCSGGKVTVTDTAAIKAAVSAAYTKINGKWFPKDLLPSGGGGGGTGTGSPSTTSKSGSSTKSQSSTQTGSGTGSSSSHKATSTSSKSSTSTSTSSGSSPSSTNVPTFAHKCLNAGYYFTLSDAQEAIDKYCTIDLKMDNPGQDYKYPPQGDIIVSVGWASSQTGCTVPDAPRWLTMPQTACKKYFGQIVNDCDTDTASQKQGGTATWNSPSGCIDFVINGAGAG